MANQIHPQIVAVLLPFVDEYPSKPGAVIPQWLYATFRREDWASCVRSSVGGR